MVTSARSGVIERHGPLADAPIWNVAEAVAPSAATVTVAVAGWSRHDGGVYVVEVPVVCDKLPGPDSVQARSVALPETTAVRATPLSPAETVVVVTLIWTACTPPPSE